MKEGHRQLLNLYHRDRLPKGWSYPVGIQMLSEELSGITQFEKIDLFFYYRQGGSISSVSKGPGFAEVDSNDRALGYYNFKELITVKWIDGLWGFWILAVPSNERAFVKKIIRTFILPKVHQWFEMERSETWYEGTHLYESGLHESQQMLCFRHIHNDLLQKFERVELNV